MATPLTDAINALTRYANETTGASDTTLSDAVESLVAGYGGGGASLEDIMNNEYTKGDLDITVKRIPPRCFYNCTSITGAITVRSVTKLEGGGFEFYGVDNATSISLPDLEEANNSASTIYVCRNLAHVDLPKIKAASGQNWFFACLKLEEVVWGKYGAITDLTETMHLTWGWFGGNTSTKIFDVCCYAALDGGISGTKIETFIFRSSKIATLNNTAYAPAGLKTIYCPAEKVEEYKTATNWSTLYNNGLQILPIEGSIYETQYADGTPIT